MASTPPTLPSPPTDEHSPRDIANALDSSDLDRTLRSRLRQLEQDGRGARATNRAVKMFERALEKPRSAWSPKEWVVVVIFGGGGLAALGCAGTSAAARSPFPPRCSARCDPS